MYFVTKCYIKPWIFGNFVASKCTLNVCLMWINIFQTIASPIVLISSQAVLYLAISIIGKHSIVLYHKFSIYHGYIGYDSAHSTTITMLKTLVRFALTKDTTYLTLTGELSGVFRELYEEKWPRYIDSALYFRDIPHERIDYKCHFSERTARNRSTCTTQGHPLL